MASSFLKCSSLICLILSILGCSSNPDYSPIAYDANKSEALNIANQTILTKDYIYALQKKRSPLRDFTQEEVDELKASLQKGSAGNLSIAFGAMSLLTGDLVSGAIDISGGIATNIASSDHLAAQPRWLVVVNKSDFTSALEAKESMEETIKNTAISLLKEKGNQIDQVLLRPKKKAILTGSEISEETGYTINGSSFLFRKNIKGNNEQLPIVAHTNLIDSPEQYAAITDKYNVIGNVISVIPFIKGDVEGYHDVAGYYQYLLDLTDLLPDGYYLYIPTFMKSYSFELQSGYEWDCKDFGCKKTVVHRLNSQVVPAIYHKGKKHEFIAPL
ncbi:MAG: hypothetical protein V7735_00515 [Photobacterium frigidiphilum]|uniref:hypothetical protein n=1 Tax=Photobacterium frigidiphilum TaxID=264736 RepID=UPI003002AE37